MKRLVALLLLLSMLFCATVAQAEDSVRVYGAKDYHYIILSDGTAEIVAYTGDDTHVFIPSYVGDCLVTSIGSDTFFWREEIVEIVLPPDVTTIKHGAFFSCTALQSFVIPETVTTITGNPFTDCTSLDRVELAENHPNFVIQDGVLYDTQKQQLICALPSFDSTVYTVPDGITSIGYSAFDFCRSLQELILPDSVTEIGELAFAGCPNLTHVKLPTELTCIPDYLFVACYALRDLMIPETVTSIGSYAFHSCWALTNPVIPASVTSIGRYAFLDIVDFQPVVTPGSYAEQYCMEYSYSYTYSQPE